MLLLESCSLEDFKEDVEGMRKRRSEVENRLESSQYLLFVIDIDVTKFLE